jgi:hypothetical protein
LSTNQESRFQPQRAPLRESRPADCDILRDSCDEGSLWRLGELAIALELETELNRPLLERRRLASGLVVRHPGHPR